MKRQTSPLLVATFALLAMSILVGAHIYLARRIIFDPGMPPPWSGLAQCVVVLLGASIVLVPVGERLLPRRVVRVIAWPTSLWMGFAFLLTAVLIASDVLIWLVGNAALASVPDGPAAEQDGARSVASWRAWFATSAALVSSAAGLRSGLSLPRHERVDVALERWPTALNGFRIVQISDIHIGSLLGRRFAARLTDRVNALDADLVAVTGDLVDGSVAVLSDEVAPFAELRSRFGVYFVTGNHDHYSDAGAWAKRAEALGFRVLRNELVEVQAARGSFDLAGVDDHRGDLFGAEGGEDLDAALAGRDPTRPVVLLAHDPSTFKRASRLGVDLQISGHTHGGQIWPFAAFVRLLIPWVAGHYRVGCSQLYVSRGSGFWGPPMRLLAPAEITELVLRSAGADRES